MEPKSNLERYRQERESQVEERRESIIQAAQTLFLERGLENTTMADIARQAQISKVTLYRYFSDQAPIALEVAARMIELIVRTSTRDLPPDLTGIYAIREGFLNMIHEFDALQNAYRYIGMFDHLYARNYPSEELGKQYKERMAQVYMERFPAATVDELHDERYGQVMTIANTIMSFLEKMAARGQLMEQEQEVPMRKQIQYFENMVTLYFDSIISGEQDV